MIRDDIMKLMKESYERGQSDLMESCKEAAAIAIATAILAEREACAKVCKSKMPNPVVNWSDAQIVEALRDCAAAILERGTHETTI